MEREKALAIGVSAVVAAAVIGWIAGRQIRSPAEIAANTAPPDASLISVPVQKTRLASEVVTRGTVGYGSPVEVSMPISPLKPGSSIVTQAPTKGAELAEGSVVFTLSGRPVFVLQGAQPASRDLGPGTQGADVLQLEDALARLGFDPGARDGVYDGGTATAVAAWYQSANHSPFGPTPEQLAEVRAANADRGAAQIEVANADEALATAQGNEAAAIAAVATAQSALDNAVAEEQLAQQQLSQGQAADPPLTYPELAALQTALRTAQSAVRTAQSELDAANAAVGPASSAVAAAERRVATARRNVGAAGAGAPQLGITVPADEVLFFPVLPVRVNDVAVLTGEEATGPVMTVSGSQLAVEGALPQSDQKLVREGAAVRIEEPELSIRAGGTVTDVATTPGPPPPGIDPARYFLQVTPTDLPASLVGTSVILKISVGSTEGEVLAVPIGALSVAANGDSRVQVQGTDGGTRYVIVTPGLSAQGLVAVTPVRGKLAAGDLVILGRGASKTAPVPTVTTTRRSTTTSTPATTVPGADRRRATGG